MEKEKVKTWWSVCVSVRELNQNQISEKSISTVFLTENANLYSLYKILWTWGIVIEEKRDQFVINCNNVTFYVTPENVGHFWPRLLMNHVLPSPYSVRFINLIIFGNSHFGGTLAGNNESGRTWTAVSQRKYMWW